MRNEYRNWELENEWLNAFAKAFVRHTRGLIRNVGIEADEGRVWVYGRAKNYYAAQLAIHCIQTYNQNRSPFPMTQLSLEVDTHPLELSIRHRFDRAHISAPSIRKNEPMKKNERRRELALA